MLKRSLAWMITYAKLGQSPKNRRVALTATIKGDVNVGDYTYVGGYSEIRGTLSQVTIGRYCSIGRGVKIFSRGQTHASAGLSTYPFFVLDPSLDRDHFNPPVPATSIGHDVWIGSNAIILAGVQVGDGAVIGASAVVTKDVPPFSITVGSPARVIGTRFSDHLTTRLQESRWWDLDYSELKRRYPDLVTRNTPLQESMLQCEE